VLHECARDRTFRSVSSRRGLAAPRTRRSPIYAALAIVGVTVGLLGADAAAAPSASTDVAANGTTPQLAGPVAGDFATPGGPNDGVAAPSTGAALPTGSWQPIGPAPIGPASLQNGLFYGGNNSGRVTALVAIGSGAHSGRIVLGSAGGGIWTSIDGSTWTARTDGQSNLAIGAIGIDPNNSEHLIAGTGEANQCGDCFYGNGILNSTDGGDTWTRQDPGGVFDGLHIAQVAIDPTNSLIEYAATDVGLFVTTNGGTTWAEPTGATYANVNGRTTAVVTDPSGGLYVASGTGTWSLSKSTDHGVTFSQLNTGFVRQATAPFIAVAVSASTPTTMYAASGGTGTNVVYKSTNGGANWAAIAAPDYMNQAYAYASGTSSQGWYDNTIAVDPTNANHVVAGGITGVETIDGGATWTNLNGKTFFAAGTNRFHPDFHAITFRADGTVLLGTDGGPYLYNPTASTITNYSGNLSITQFYPGFGSVGGVVLAGAQDNSSALTNGSTSWTAIFSGDGGYSAIVPNNPNMMFIETNGTLRMTADSFATMKVMSPSVGSSNFTPPMTISANTADPANPAVYYGADGLYRTTNPSAATPTWTNLTGTANGIVSAIAIAPSDPTVIYVGYNSGVVQKSVNGGGSFSTLSTHPFGAGNYVTGLSVNPSNPNELSASFAIRSTNRFSLSNPHAAQWNGSTWVNITGNLPTVGAVSRVVYANANLLAATDFGIFGSTDGGTNWTPVGTGLPAVQVMDINVATDGIYIVTHGRGSWKLPVAADALLRVTTNPAVPSQIIVDNNPSDTWGLTWMKIAPGSHTVCFRDVPGFATPGCQAVTTTAGATTVVSGVFTQRGTLRVITTPAVASTISVDGTPRNDWGMWTDLDTGSHQVCFGLVAGFTPPSCQTVNVTAGATTTVTGTFVANAAAVGPTGYGTLRITTAPAVPTQVLVDGAIADSWGAWFKIAPGSHTVCFTGVEGYTTPSCQSANVTVGATTDVTGTFIARGFLRAITSPAVAGTVSVDGIPRNDWGMWTDLPTGAHTICFGAVAGKTTPTCQPATVTAGTTTTITGTYT
jgi:hypothetical protein